MRNLKQKLSKYSIENVPCYSSVIYDEKGNVFVRKVMLCGDAGSIKLNKKIVSVVEDKKNRIDSVIQVWKVAN